MQEHELILKALKQILRNQHFIMEQLRVIHQAQDMSLRLDNSTLDRLRKETGKLHEMIKTRIT